MTFFANIDFFLDAAISLAYSRCLIGGLVMDYCKKEHWDAATHHL